MQTSTRLIPLTQGQFAIVDEVDYEWAMQWRWRADKHGRSHTYYAIRGVWIQPRPKRKLKTFHMHREIAMRAGLPESNGYDHKDRNGLNNTRENIRPCTQLQNSWNTRKRTGTTSRFKGVSWHKWHSMWRARIKIGSKQTFLGYFTNEREAANAYATAARQYFGEFAFAPL